MIRVVVDYGFDLHTISISKPAFALIEAGCPIIVEDQGFFVEGALEVDRWAFHCGAVGAVHVSTDTGREVFEGYLGDSEVDVQDG